MNFCETETQPHLEYNQLLEDFILGCKTTQRIGMEYERIPVEKSTSEVVSYYGENGVCEFLRKLAKEDNWDYILDGVNIIGLKKLHDTITLEPGCQVELSLEPQNFVRDIKSKIEHFDKTFKPIMDEFGITLINKGVSPKTTYQNIQLLPKQRYKLMANYLWGILSDVMMRETAGIQVGIDYKSEFDAMKKFLAANLMMPFSTAMFANSKIRGGVDTGYKSFRALAWLNTDNERCGFASNLVDGMVFKNYVDRLLDVPMIFIYRDERTYNLNGKVTFKQFMNKGYEGFNATIEDWQLHSNLYFPEVRLRNFIEIRNHDCVGGGLEYSIPALYRGIMYDSSSLDELIRMLGKYSYSEISELRYNVARYATASKLRKYSILDICKELVDISAQALKKEGENEECFLEPLAELLKQNKLPCDIDS